MTGRAGRVPQLTPHTYVLTAAEVARLYFRRGPDYVRDGTLWKEHRTFPQAQGGLFLRKQVEVWMDSVFGVSAESHLDRVRAVMMDEAKRGTRSGETRR